MAIPKMIHYCWFGGNELSELAEKCIASWNKFCSDYQIIEWNETNFDIKSAPQYVREAYALKKWAFVSDYVRLWALVEHGGVYMDTDVELLRPIDCFLENHAFSGFETPQSVPTGIMGAEKGFSLFQNLLETYSEKRFILKDGTLNTETNTVQITRFISKYDFSFNDSYQLVCGMAFYPHDFFCPKDYYTEKIKLTKNTFAIHHFAKSWCAPETSKQRFLRMHPTINRIYHIPNRIGMLLLGHRYETLKAIIKRGKEGKNESKEQID